jgi:xanthine dehydrogenase accessory factor
MKSATLARLHAERAAKRAVVLLTRLSDGAQLLWPGDEMPAELVEAESSSFTTPQAVLPLSLIQLGNLFIEPLAQSL